MPGLFVIIYFKDPSLSFEFNSLRPQFFKAISDSNFFQLMFLKLMFPPFFPLANNPSWADFRSPASPPAAVEREADGS